MASHATATSAVDKEFVDAQNQFLNSLPATERALFFSCNSAEELLTEVKKLSRFKPEDSRWRRSFECIQRFSDNLKPYFSVVNIFVSSHPEWCAIAWGAVRLLLQLADNFTSFFDKLAEILDQVGRAFPRFRDIIGLASRDMSQRLRLLLTQFYRDLFEFFTAVARVFVRPDGKPKRTPIVITQLICLPFGARYENFLKRLEIHSEVLRDEESMIQFKSLSHIIRSQTDENGRAEEHRQQSRKYRDLVNAVMKKVSATQLKDISDSVARWLGDTSLGDIEQALWDAQQLRQDNTGTWIFDEPNYASWSSRRGDVCTQSDPFSNALWICGNPGSGKSVLATSVLDELRTSNISTAHSKQALGYFFFSFRSSKSTQRLNSYRAILSQLFRQLQEDQDALDCFTFASKQSLATQGSPSDLLALLKLLALRIPGLVLLLDGVDESDDPEDLMRSLIASLHGTGAKMIIFSRPNVKTLISSETPRVILSRQSTDADVERYLSRRLREIRQSKLPLDCDVEGGILPHLLESANGMFLWARLMMDYLESPALDPPERRLAAIWSTAHHESLSDMYVRILRSIATRIKPEREMARRILCWVAFYQHSLDRRQLWEVIYCLTTPSPAPGHTNTLIPSQEQADSFDQTVVMVCACLLERYGSGYRLVHQSVAEFFWNWSDELPSPDPQIAQFLVEPSEAHITLARECLSYLTERIPAEPLSGDMRERVAKERLADGFPFAEYACLYWMRHVKDVLSFAKYPIQSNSPSVIRAFFDLLQVVSGFFSNKLAINTWVELQYSIHTCHVVTTKTDDLHEWFGSADGLVGGENISSDARELFGKLKSLHKDMSALNTRWGSTLEINPHYIWNDVTAFEEEGSSFFRTSAVTVRSMAPTEINNASLTTTPLIILSKEAPDGDTMAVLSIYTSLFVTHLVDQRGFVRKRLTGNRKFEEGFKMIADAERLLEKSKYNGPRAGQEVNLDELSCSDWVARFETWDVSGRQKRKIMDAKFTLDETEVRENVAKSTTLRRVLGERINRTTPNVSSKWSLAFPAAISTRLDFMVILNTVYVVNAVSGEVHQGARLPPGESRDQDLEGADSPGGTDGQKKGKSATRGPRGRKKGHFRSLMRVTHSHSFLLSDDGQYVLRQDQRCLVTAVASNPVVYSLTVIGFGASRHSSDVVNRFGGPDSGVDINACSFHPTLPLVLFYTRNFLSGRIVMLWAFTAASKLDSGPSNSPPSSLLAVCPPLVGIESLNFSACGTSVVVKSVGKALPDVYPLEGNSVYALAKTLPERRDQPPAATSVPAMESTSTDLTALHGTHGQSLAAPWLRMNQGLVVHNFVSYQVGMPKTVAGTSGAPRHIELTKTADSAKTTQHLVSIPDAFHDFDNSIDVSMSHTNVTSQGSNIKLVLGQGPKDWYDPAEGRQAHFPIIVDKDSRALLRADEQSLGSSNTRKRPSADSELRGDLTCPRKQRLLEYDAGTDSGDDALFMSSGTD